MPLSHITSPHSPELEALCRKLAELAPGLSQPNADSREQLALCAVAGVHAWFLPRAHGGLEWSESEIIAAQLQLSAACLTTSFIFTQLSGASQRIAACGNEYLGENIVPQLATGQQIATLAISHLTTSHRHLSKPVLSATATENGFLLDGFSPWVTAAKFADYIVTGATLDDGRQILAAVPTELAGISLDPPQQLIALSASYTGAVRFNQVAVPQQCIMAGPQENVMQAVLGARTGGLQTSTLAVGLATAAIDFMQREQINRPQLSEPAEALREQAELLKAQLLAAADGATTHTGEEMRIRANSLALRATQAALAAAKGAGFVEGHPAGRWCREALFFLVWSCPQPVLAANLCELACIVE